ncbi:MAG: hypothetical protein Q9226_004623 [Calogaya cf. arnoldii]
MSRPSPLAISVSSIRRLLKEETTYRTELVNQESRLQRLESEGGEDDDGNREWSVRQEKQAIQETKAIFEPLREKLLGAVGGLEQLLNSPQAEQFSEEEVNGARELIAKAKAG